MVYNRTPHTGRDLLFPFGSLAQEFEKAFNATTTSTYPPYNVVQVDEDEWILEFAVAGLNKNDLDVTVHKGVLTIKNDTTNVDLPEGQKYLHKGIANRKFVRSFTLPEHTEVLKAETRDGILSITLVRSVPEEKKPKSIKID
jgi:molecular chaperone IbpA